MKSALLVTTLLLCRVIAAPLLPDAEETPRMKEWRELKYGMFLHFGMSTFTGNELDPGTAPSTTYAPLQIDADQWLRVAEEAGMKYAVLTSKHVAGHCLWDSKARIYADVMDANGKVICASGWLDSPTESRELVFVLPPGRQVSRLVLYTSTKDGKRAENRFASVVFEQNGRHTNVDLNPPVLADPSARLDIARAVVRAGDTTVRALACFPTIRPPAVMFPWLWMSPVPRRSAITSPCRPRRFFPAMASPGGRRIRKRSCLRAPCSVSGRRTSIPPLSWVSVGPG